MKVIFRADVSVEIGTGHLARCATLADALLGDGDDVGFVVAGDEGIVSKWFTGRRYKIIRKEEQADWIVVDHYRLAAEWESKARETAARVMAIDDLADRPHDCDLLLDQNFRAPQDNPYVALVPRHARLLLGPKYALLGAEFAARRRPRDGSVRRILVSYGGTDRTNETAKALRAVELLGRTDLEVDVAVGAAHAHADALRAAAGRNVRLHEGLTSLAALMASCDLALGAGGTSTWERLCLGLPSIVTATADNQLRSCRLLAENGYLEYLGPAHTVTAELLRDALARRIGQPRSLARDSARGQSLVDGRGAARVAAEMRRVA